MTRGVARPEGRAVEAPTSAIDPHHSNAFARRLFNGIAGGYEGPANVFSFFQYGRWHRFLVSRLQLTPRSSVLDVCTGTGMVATQIATTIGCPVIGLDLSERMIERARHELSGLEAARSVSLLKGRAESLPFADDSFDAVVFTFLLRYVDDPADTIGELARVLRPGGRMASLEFFLPQGPVLRSLWRLHTRVVMPLAARTLSPEWQEVASFLGPSISGFYRENSLEGLRNMWNQAGFSRVQTRALSLGGAVVTWGQKEA